MEEMPFPMGGPALLWMALLLFSPHGMSADPSKSMVSLNPPWNRILEEDSVTLTCHSNNSLEVNSTKWTHNNHLLEYTTSSLNIVKAKLQDGGEYRCQNKGSNQSDPVHLGVFQEWLILQSSAEELVEGESLHIRCHGWRNLNVSKVTYYRNGKALKYWYENFDMAVARATVKDNGSYYCTGRIRRQIHASDTVDIIVKRNSSDQNGRQRAWLQFLIPLLVVILFAVDTGLFISTQQQLTLLLKIKRTRKNKKPEPEKK